jgi:hypothetical protein
VTINWVWIGNSIYCTLRHNLWLYFTDRCYTLMSSVTVFTNLMVTASSGGRSLSSGYPNCPRASATEILHNWLFSTELFQETLCFHRLTTHFSITTLVISVYLVVWSLSGPQRKQPSPVLLLLSSHCITQTANQPSCNSKLVKIWRMKTNESKSVTH